MNIIKTHVLKILSEYALPKLLGVKPFEIRKNDRDFKVGDWVVYSVIDNKELYNEMIKKVYKIICITDYAQQDGYVVFTDKLLGE